MFFSRATVRDSLYTISLSLDPFLTGNLVGQLITRDPTKRITAEAAAHHECYSSDISEAIEKILEAYKAHERPPKVATEQGNMSPSSANDKQVACCLSVDGPGHPSADNGANFFLYARVVNLPSVCSHHVHKPKLVQGPPSTSKVT